MILAGHAVTKPRGSTWVMQQVSIFWCPYGSRHRDLKPRCRQPGAAAGPCFPQEIHVHPRNSDRQISGFGAEIVFLEADRGSLHGSYCFWLDADLGFTSGSHFLLATTGIFLFFFFKTMNFWMMQWKKQPPGEQAGLPKPHNTPQ